MTEKKDDEKQTKKDDCPLCKVSEETLNILKKKGDNKIKEKSKNNNEKSKNNEK